ncbi:MAG: RNA polymerase factor sigma-54 [Hyphomicrobiales bacterium]|nr:RNA polymerase factor sigma-54 [Hyphomicrobiales bacterium]MCP5370339.1 RNA polymerase factor sigma-54 [Hyphomicrobiales bacterium]
MALTPRLDLRQTQSLVMTPQLQQAIKLLQLNNLELTEYVEQELEENPLLERDEGARDDLDRMATGEAPEGVPDPPEDESGHGDQDALDSIDFTREDSVDSAETADLDVDYDNLWNNDTATDLSTDTALDTYTEAGLGDHLTAGTAAGGFDDSGSNLENYVSEHLNLRDHLMGQLSLELTDPVDRIIGLHLIDSLDDAGYVPDDLSSLAQVLNCDLARVEETLAKVQRFDPTGIFARSLAECLALQLRELDRLDPAMQALLDNLDLLAERRTRDLLDICGIGEEDLVDMIAEIRALNPKPAQIFDDNVAQPITPDVLMRAKPGGGWIIELNQDTLPRVLVNNQYYAQIHSAARTREDKQYISERLQSANWLVKSLHQRATTILKVATELVRQQDGFFTNGVQYLRPLVLRDIAEAIEMHESTVSRVTSNKFMATPRGIFELKYFFTTALSSSSGGEAHSAESVRHRIRALIDAESPKAIMSDDKIVEILRQESVDIARRTVAKYRESMGIPSSVQRRREKSVQM